jgi:hypothetical protein
MRGFWRGVIAGSLLGAAMSMYMEPKSNIMGPRQRKQANRMIKGMSHSVRDMMK